SSDVEIPNGNLNMNNNRVQQLGAADSTDDAMPRGDIVAEFVDASGDTMSGDLDMTGNDIRNVNSIGNGTGDVAVTSDIDLRGNSITSTAGEVCVGDQCA
ncbi:MAG: hypothetical protein ABEI07_00165, partial [Candidatus Nanohaloarchaea archaeon]